MFYTQDELKEIITYNPETGLFVNNNTGNAIGFKHNTRTKKDKQLGKKDKYYMKIQIGKKRYYAHRLAWLYVYGSIPMAPFQIDHIDGNGLNNCISNLRIVNPSENNFNMTKAKGYHLDKRRNKYVARLIVYGKRISLGSYEREDDARRAYLNAKSELHKIS